VIAGECHGNVGLSFLWTAATGMVPLPAIAGYPDMMVRGMTADGAVVVGDSLGDGIKRQVFRWTAAAGTVGSGFPPGFEGTSFGTFGMTPDGMVMIGVALRAGVQSHAFVWRERAGMVALGPLPQAAQTGRDRGSVGRRLDVLSAARRGARLPLIEESNASR
jgi:hypothetical protein